VSKVIILFSSARGFDWVVNEMPDGVLCAICIEKANLSALLPF
jgi:hypothetical protein